MALTKVSGPLLNSGNHNLGNYVINNITGAAATFTSLDCSNIDLSKATTLLSSFFFTSLAIILSPYLGSATCVNFNQIVWD